MPATPCDAIALRQGLVGKVLSVVPSEGGGRRSPRTWGYWTEHKLAMLAAYLQRFTTASKQARGTLYLDLFAGEPKNQSRTTGEEISGSPRVALDTVPPFTKLLFFELPHHAAQLETELRTAYPTREFEVLGGDCNDRIGPVLDRLSFERWNWAPTFAMVDQQAAEVKWSTLEQLSKFKVRTKPKVELWLLFAPSMLPRGLASVDPDAVERFADRITAMYGSEDWRDAYVARSRELLSGGELRDELLNLMRWRMENLLGYRVTHPFEMKNTRGTPLFNMIFATDHPAGERIMNHIYGTAAQERPRMQAEAAANTQEAKEEKLGTPGLFAPMPKTIKPDNLYVHQPPTRPYRLPADV